MALTVLDVLANSCLLTLRDQRAELCPRIRGIAYCQARKFGLDGDAALRGRPPELEISLDSADYVALLTASRVTPMALALVHRSCPATAEIFGATGGYYCRYAISHTEGATFGPNPSVEDIATNWDVIRNGSPPNELDGEAMAWGVKAYFTRLQALAAQLQTAGS